MDPGFCLIRRARLLNENFLVNASRRENAREWRLNVTKYENTGGVLRSLVLSNWCMYHLQRGNK